MTFLLPKQSLTVDAYPLHLRVSTRVQREPQENWLPLEAVPPCDTGLHVTKCYYDAPPCTLCWWTVLYESCLQQLGLVIHP